METKDETPLVPIGTIVLMNLNMGNGQQGYRAMHVIEKTTTLTIFNWLLSETSATKGIVTDLKYIYPPKQ
jgi:hypothetical protein